MAHAAASLGAGAATGATIITLGLVALRTIQRRGVAETQDIGFALLTGSVFTGMIAAAAAAWMLSRGIAEAWRRAVVSTLGVVGALMLSLVAAPTDFVAGRGGLFLYLILLIGGGLWAFRLAKRAV